MVDSDNPPFKVRAIDQAPNDREPCREHLLDGQQRLTALWKAFRGSHTKHAFYVKFRLDGGQFFEKTDGCIVEAVSKVGRHKDMIGNAAAEFQNGWIPIRILSRNDEGSENRIAWREDALSKDASAPIRRKLEKWIDELRDRICDTRIPYFSLSQDTSREDAIDIFIRTNQSSVKLTSYDVAVAQMEDQTEESLRDKINDLMDDVPAIARLEGKERKHVGNLVLKIQCLLEEKRPTEGSYQKLDFRKLNDNWNRIVEGIEWTVGLLAQIGIRSADRLPTAVPLRVLPPLRKYMPESGTAQAAAMEIVQRYLWAAFLTDRYKGQANDLLKEDYEQLREALDKGAAHNAATVPALAGVAPDVEAVRKAGWPSGNRLGKAILAACSLGGARDVASNQELKGDGNVDLHHIFPRSVLKKHDLPQSPVLNCMLLHSPTNKSWSKDLPGDFLHNTIVASDGIHGDPERAITERLRTHLVPAERLLAVRKETVDAEDKAAVEQAYERFIEERAALVHARIESLLRTGEIETS